MNSSPSCKYRYDSKLAKKIEFIEILIAMVIIVFSIVSIVSYNTLKTQISTEIVSYGLGALFLITIVIEVIPTIFNPIFGLAVALASGIDFYLSTAVCLAAVILGGIWGFWLGKKYGFGLVCAMAKKESIQTILRFKDKYGNFFMFLSAFSPLPYFPIIFGAVLVEKKDFIVYGLIPRALFIIAGAYMIQLGIINNL